MSLAFIYARALAAQGQWQAASNQFQSLWSQQSGHPDLQDLPAFAGSALFRAGYREVAAPWLRIAHSLKPNDAEIARMWRACELPAYLEPEVYDPIEEEVLLRYSPRESNHYVYAIDIIGTCNLKCPSCPVANSSDEGRAKGTMPLALFSRILDKIVAECPDRTPQIWLYNWGEPLLHPKLPEIIAMIRARGLLSMISSNLNYSRGLDHLAKALPDTIKISLSGFHPTTYDASHTGGDINRVKTNMRRLADLVAASDTPCDVWVGHHLYRHNFHEQDEVRTFSESLGFTWSPIQAFWQPIEQLIELEESGNLASPLLKELMVDPRGNLAFSRAHQQPEYDCELRFNQTTINVDGSVSLCCSTYSIANRLPVKFLDADHQALTAMKYEHGFCQTCRNHGCDYAARALPASTRAG